MAYLSYNIMTVTSLSYIYFIFFCLPLCLQYLAPEVLRKEAYDRTVDWWCLGAVIYEMIYSLVCVSVCVCVAPLSLIPYGIIFMLKTVNLV